MFQIPNAFQCTDCDYVSTRLQLLRSHAACKHGIQPHSDPMRAFLADCLRISKRGWRETDEKRVFQLMGEYASSASHREVALRVLRGHLVKVRSNEARSREVPDKTATQLRADDGSEKGKRGKTLQLLRQAGFVASFDPNDLCSMANSYFTVRSRDSAANKRTLVANAKFIHRYILWGMTQFATMSEQAVVSSAALAKKFEEAVRDILAPNSIRNHAAALFDLLQCASANWELKREFSKKEHLSLRGAAKAWLEIKQRCDNRARGEQRTAIMNGVLSEAPVSEIIGFLDHMSRSGRIQAAINNLKENLPFCSSLVPIELQPAWRELLCVLATYLLLQCVRLSAATNLTLSEVRNATQLNGQYIVRIKTHKTAKTFGSAAVVLKHHQYQLFVTFCELRDRLNFNSQTVLVSTAGGEPRNLFGSLQQFLQNRMKTPIGITFNLMRKTVETNTFLLDQTHSQLNENLVSNYLLHGTRVTDLHYKFRSDALVCGLAAKCEEVLCQIVLSGLITDEQKQFVPEDAIGKQIYIL